MQYENNLRKKCFVFLSKTRFGFQKAFFQKVHLEKGGSSYNQGRLIFGSIRYSLVNTSKMRKPQSK